ncbi:MAG: hypothetical protein A3F17_02085 [Gammaproteobacteria bacterium RIFCSPHIGHO2_12_FULL_41_15]|nr:MAG: hypothetical protein A3F17_02085 [Gammaproteobacteria bacterium RIFCSPHIGHO2_12_FULL_41_15]
MKHFTQLMAIGLFTTTLTGCSFLATGDRTGKVSDPAKQEQMTEQQLTSRIQQSGGTVMVQGDQIDFALPVNQFFDDSTTQLKEKQQATLKNIARLIQTKGPTANVVVVGYTNNSGTVADQKKRAQQHAEVIAAYLWNQGINSKNITVKSMGSQDAVAYSDTAAGSQANRRIMILVNHQQQA